MSRRRGFGNGHDQVRYDVGALEQRVYGLENAISGIAAQISGLSTKIDERGRPQWMLLVSVGGFLLAFMASIGTLAYLPIKDSQSRIEAAIQQQQIAFGSLGEKFVTIRELDARTARGQTDFTRINADLRQLNENVVPRNELTERWRSNENQQLNLQRQIDDQKKAFGDTFSLRDALQAMQRRIDVLEGRQPR